MQSTLTLETVTKTVEMLELHYWVSPDSASVLVPFEPADDHGGYAVSYRVNGQVLASRIIPKDAEDLAHADPGAVLAMCAAWNATNYWPTAVVQVVPKPIVYGDIAQLFALAPPLQQLAASIEMPLIEAQGFVRAMSKLVRDGGLALDDEALAAFLDDAA